MNVVTIVIAIIVRTMTIVLCRQRRGVGQYIYGGGGGYYQDVQKRNSGSWCGKEMKGTDDAIAQRASWRGDGDRFRARPFRDTYQ